MVLGTIYNVSLFCRVNPATATGSRFSQPRTASITNILFQGGRAQLHAVHVREGGEEAERRPLRPRLNILPDPRHPGKIYKY